MLNVLICAFEKGIEHLAVNLPEPSADVCYFISWQGHNIEGFVLPEVISKRSDVKVSKLEGRGLSRNRNNCVKMALESQAEGFFMLADEDIKFVKRFQQTIQKAFSLHSQAAILCFQVSSGDPEKPFKNYPSESKPITFQSIDRVSSIEITGRMKVLEKVKFDERLGLGANFPSGEETAFLADCLRIGLSLVYEPSPIVIHPFETSGKRRKNAFGDEALRLIGGRAYRIYGNKMAQAFFLFSAIKNFPKYRSQRSFLSYLAQLQQGVKEFKKLENA